MALITHKNAHRVLRYSTIALGIASILVFVDISIPTGQNVLGILAPGYTRGTVPWKTLEARQVRSGYTIPPNTNVIFHLPRTFTKITRETLFGYTSQFTRYWGYCFPESPNTEVGDTHLSGTFFMSKAEEVAILEEEQAKMRRQVLGRKSLQETDLNLKAAAPIKFRSRKDVFFPGETCFILSNTAIPIGLDSDGDTANDRVERSNNTNPSMKDTDGDGILDGVEIFMLFTSPTTRDTDGDGLIDGLEDKNRNGRLEVGETNPLKIDTDDDGLCDGFCRDTSNKITWEDKNLNGFVDKGETNPLSKDTDGDGVLDEQEYYLCQLKGNKGC